MATKINIYNEEWCDMVFDGKNKEYGAFALRTHNDQTRTKALLITISLTTVLAAGTLLNQKSHTLASDELNGKMKLINVTLEPPKTEPLDVVAPPPLPPKPTIQYSQYEVSNKEFIDDLPTQDQLLASHAVIAYKTQDGDENGAVEDLRPVKAAVGDEPAENTFIAAEQMPQFPGGTEALKEFLQKNLKYPPTASEMGIAGKVYVSFVVDKTGTINTIKIVRGIGGGCDEEAVRVIKMMGKWTPGRQNGHPVSVFFTLPVTFALTNN
jgi:TonB family C-terminal domain